MVPAMSIPAHAKALLWLGLPLIGGHIGQFAIGATDTLMLGWYSVEALAAGVLGSTFFFVLLIVGAGFAWAVMPLIAEASEQPDAERQIRRVTRMGLWLTALFSAAALAPMLMAEPILLSMGQTPETARLAGQYLSIVAIGLPPALGVMLLKAYLAALERTRIVLWVTLVAAVINGALNWVLIFGHFGFPELGIRGSAIASVAVHLVSLGLLAVYAARSFPEHQIFVRLWRPDWSAFVRVFHLGWPIGLTSLSETGLFSATAIMVGWLGTIPLAAHGIALQLASATFMVHLGLANAVTIRAGKAVGRRDPEHLRRGGHVAVAMSVLFSAVTIVVFLTFREPLIGLYLDPADPDKPAILIVGVQLVALAALFQLVDGLQVIALGLLRGVQDTRVPMVHAAISYWIIGLPAGYIGGFVLGYGAAGVWAGLVLGLASAAFLLMRRFWRTALVRLTVSGAIPEQDLPIPDAEIAASPHARA